MGKPLQNARICFWNDFAGWPDPAEVDGVVTGGIAGPDDLKPSVHVPVSKTVSTIRENLSTQWATELTFTPTVL